MYTFSTKGTCARAIDFDVRDGMVYDVSFAGGCNGNLTGIGKLVEGMPVDRVIDLLEGTTCGRKPTSCPDQLAKALRAAQEQQKTQEFTDERLKPAAAAEA